MPSFQKSLIVEQFQGNYLKLFHACQYKCTRCLLKLKATIAQLLHVLLWLGFWLRSWLVEVHFVTPTPVYVNLLHYEGVLDNPR